MAVANERFIYFVLMSLSIIKTRFQTTSHELTFDPNYYLNGMPSSVYCIFRIVELSCLFFISELH